MALVRDTGATVFPSQTGTGGFGSSGVGVTSTLISTNAASGRLVAVVCVGNVNGADMGATTFGGNIPLTWTKRIEANGGGGNTHVAQIWEANFSSQITNALFSATWGTSTTQYQTVIAIDALVGAKNSVGVSSIVTTNGVPTPMYTSLTGVLTNSISYVGVFHESAVTVLTTTGTTMVADLWSGAGVGIGAGYSTASGNFRLGWSDNMDYGGVAAYEIQEDTTTPPASSGYNHGIVLMQGAPGGRKASMNLIFTSTGKKRST